MMMAPFTVVILVLFAAALPQLGNAFGGGASTLAAVYGSATTICSIAAQQSIHGIQCWRNGQLLPPILPTVSFVAIAGGRDVLCGVRSGGFSLLCWNISFIPKRIYYDASAPLTSLTIGDTQICALRNVTTVRNGICWRGNFATSTRIPYGESLFRVISSGIGFSCGVLSGNGRVLCWGDDGFAASIQSEFVNLTMMNIQVGGRHVCGINDLGLVICKGTNDYGQLEVPENVEYEYRELALGASHSCGIRRLNRTVVCWGGNGEYSSEITDGISFESIVAGLNFTCGLTTINFSVICWGPSQFVFPQSVLNLQKSLPGPCVETACECNFYPESQTLCSGNGHICRSCDLPTRIPSVSSPHSSRDQKRGFLAFIIAGSVGGFAGICALIYCLWPGVCFGKKKIHNSVQPTITGSNAGQQWSSSPQSRSSTLKRQGSNLLRCQRSGTSSKRAETAEQFTFSELEAATNKFSLENKIGAGSFGVVYRGKLPDGREVAIKRSENGPKTKKFQEKESAFDSELAFLSRLNHKHLVRLIGFCEERDEKLLVYEYMKNGALHDHLHGSNNVQKTSSFVNSWKMRIKISLDASRGIEYLHNYAVPPVIHRDIKSSNILLDANWVARVSDFGLSLMGPDKDHAFNPAKAAGTVGYIDPEYYGLNVVTAKSDVYGLGVVLLELLTGKRAIFRMGENGGVPTSVVDYAVPAIMIGEVGKILDSRVGHPEGRESEAVELVAYTAMHCVHVEGKDRPSVSDIVVNLERALALCEGSHGSISSDPISIVSE